MIKEFIILTIIIYCIQLAVATVFLATDRAEDVGVERKMQGILYLVLPYYFVYTIGKAVARTLKKMD